MEGEKKMNRQESLDFLQSCIDRVNSATEKECEQYRQMYEIETSRLLDPSEFELISSPSDRMI